MKAVNKKLPFNPLLALGVFVIGSLLAWGYLQLSKKQKTPEITYPPQEAGVIAPTTPPHNTPTPGNPQLDNPTLDLREEIKQNQIAQGTSEVSVTKDGFSPKTITVKKGGIVTFTNNDSVDHQISGDSGLWGKKTPLAPGKKYSQQFDVPDTYPYSCKLVPSLKGEIVVVD